MSTNQEMYDIRMKKIKQTGIAIFIMALAAAWLLGQQSSPSQREVREEVKRTHRIKNVPVDYTEHNDAVFEREKVPKCRNTDDDIQPAEKIHSIIREMNEQGRAQVSYKKELENIDEFLLYYAAYKHHKATGAEMTRNWFFLSRGIHDRIRKLDSQHRDELLAGSPDMFPDLSYYFLGIKPTDPVWQKRYDKNIRQGIARGYLAPSKNWPPEGSGLPNARPTGIREKSDDNWPEKSHEYRK